MRTFENNQSVLTKLVDREVIMNVSTVIHELSKNEDSEYAEELMDVQSSSKEVVSADQYRYTIESDEIGEFLATVYSIDSDGDDVEVFTIDDISHGQSLISDGFITDIRDPKQVIDYYYKEILGSVGCPDHYLEAWDDVEMEDNDREALEFWAVSKWFAEKLEEQGELVEEVAGMHVWGRTISGQSVICDGVILRIAESMEILQGMQNAWLK